METWKKGVIILINREFIPEKKPQISVLLTQSVNISIIALGLRPQTPRQRRLWRDSQLANRCCRGRLEGCGFGGEGGGGENMAGYMYNK